MADVLRSRMYAVDYGNAANGKASYAGLATNASVCSGCAGPCLAACPHGLDVPDLTRATHELLGSG